MKAWQAGLLGGLGALLANVVSCSSAHAVLGVGDIVYDPTAVAELVKEVENGIRTLEQLKAQYDAIAHLPDNIRGMAGQLANNGALQNPYPAVNALSRYTGGYGLTEGAAALLEQNRVAEPEGDDWMAEEMNRRATSTANLQAVALQHMQVVEDRQQALQQFYDGIGDSPDIQQTAAIQARLQLEQNFAAGQQAQAQQLTSLVQLQNRVDHQRIEERQRKEAKELYDATGSGMTVAAE